MSAGQIDDEHFDDYAADDTDFQIDEYDLTATPNDFNVLTIFHFIESGAVKIPGFQRNYVWDVKRASKLVESLMLGLPVPMGGLVRADAELDEWVKAFLGVGRERNRLVHLDYGSFALEKTAEEIYAAFVKANVFDDRLRALLDAYESDRGDGVPATA